jgi:hypothetical protein
MHADVIGQLAKITNAPTVAVQKDRQISGFVYLCLLHEGPLLQIAAFLHNQSSFAGDANRDRTEVTNNP